MSKPRYKGLKTRIHCRDFDSSLAFYGEVLGLRLVRQWHSGSDRGAIFALGEQPGDAYLELGEDSQLPQRPESGSLSLQLQVADCAETALRLKERWPCRGPVDRPWQSRYLYLQDPDGLQVILFDGEI